jgi:hypothetical protein
MPILCDWDLAVDADKVLWGQGANPAIIRSRRPALATIAEEVIAEGSPMLAPIVLYRSFPVEGLQHERLRLAGGGSLRGPLISKHLAGSAKVIVAVCTVGDALSNYASARFDQDPVRSLALDGLASAAAEALAEAACQRFESLAAAEGLNVSTPLNPGMIGWPLDAGQEQLFALVDASEIGVTLGRGGLMQPLKSLSLVLGLGRDLDTEGCTCDYCTMRDTCRFKKSGKEQHG